MISIYSSPVEVDELMFLRKLKIVIDNPQDFNEAVLRMLPLWCPNLKELVLYSNGGHIKADSLNRNFPKLELISLGATKNFVDDDIEKFLKWNSQLVDVCIWGCDLLTNRVIQLIGKYLPNVERVALELEVKGSSDDLNYQFNSGEFSRLTSLHLVRVKYATSIINDIAAKNIPVADLFIFDFDGDVDVLVDKISGLKKLRRLELLSVGNLNASHIQKISNQLPKLSRIGLDLHAAISFVDILMDNIMLNRPNLRINFK